ncbi:alpha/beta hydrolase [Nocardioides sp. MAHUQ-72]|uniref:alpha/beta hydrolase n=1 Tax=unclassified Nocardioides TaxID=2615069 RepID=UPI0036068DE2
MAVLTCDLFSEALEMGTSLTVVLPQATRSQIGVEQADGDGELPVLYLLHGLSDDHTAWTRYTSIERYAAAAGLAVVMPAVGRSFYADERHGHRYWTYVSEELPQVVSSFFRVSGRREDTFVAGLSMGGYGALKLALTHPGRFAAAASLSGALDIATMAQGPERAPLFEQVFGGVPGPADDLFALLDRAPVADLPPMHVSCGYDDPLFPLNERFVARAQEVGADVTTDFRPGTHEWGLWDTVVRDVIDWLPRRP